MSLATRWFLQSDLHGGERLEMPVDLVQVMAARSGAVSCFYRSSGKDWLLALWNHFRLSFLAASQEVIIYVSHEPTLTHYCPRERKAP